MDDGHVERELLDLAVEKLRGWGQWAALEPLPPEVRFATVESDARFHNWGLYVRLLEASRWYMRTEPAEAVDVVRLAILVAEHLDPAVVGEKRVADLRAAAWAALGNVKRVDSDFEGSRQAFNEAWRICEEGSGPPPRARPALDRPRRAARVQGRAGAGRRAGRAVLPDPAGLGAPQRRSRGVAGVPRLSGAPADGLAVLPHPGLLPPPLGEAGRVRVVRRRPRESGHLPRE